MLDATDPAALKECICRSFPEHTVKDTPCGVKILGDIDLNAVLKTVLDENITLLSVNCNQVSFEEYYLSLIGGKHHE
jgi:hypothetical protein